MSNATSPDSAEAERLKNLGNDLFGRKDYRAAHHKYTEAIKRDPNNAILYANRAATLLGTKEYMDAADDCRKALEIDPTYARAWGRLAVAKHSLADWTECFQAWQKALDCLPSGPLSLAEQAMKAQFTQGLARARAAAAKVESTVDWVTAKTEASGRLPWDVATSLREEKMKDEEESCVYVVHDAYKELKLALEYLSQVEVVEDVQGDRYLKA